MKKIETILNVSLDSSQFRPVNNELVNTTESNDFIDMFESTFHQFDSSLTLEELFVEMQRELELDEDEMINLLSDYIFEFMNNFQQNNVETHTNFDVEYLSVISEMDNVELLTNTHDLQSFVENIESLLPNELEEIFANFIRSKTTNKTNSNQITSGVEIEMLELESQLIDEGNTELNSKYSGDQPENDLDNSMLILQNQVTNLSDIDVNNLEFSTLTETSLNTNLDNIVNSISNLNLEQVSTNEIVVKLTPESLGEIIIEISTTDEGIVGSINVENKDAQSMLLTMVDEVKETLSDQGINMESLDVNLSNSSEFEQNNMNEDIRELYDKISVKNRSKSVNEISQIDSNTVVYQLEKVPEQGINILI